MKRILALGLIAFLVASAPVAAESPAGMILYFESEGEVYLLLAEHRNSQRGWGAFGGGDREGETMAQTAAHKAQDESRGYFKMADLLKEIEGQKPIMDGGFANYFAEVDFVPAPRIQNHPPPDSTDSYLERSTYAWIPYSIIEPMVQTDIDRKKKYTIDPLYLPAGSQTDWFWPIWLGNIRKAVVADALPWGK